jgi:hypothetical protein
MQTLKFYQDHLISKRSIVIVFDHGSPSVLNSGSGRFEEVKALLRAGQFQEAIEIVDLASAVSHKTNGKFSVVDGLVVIDDEQLPNALSDKLLEFVEANLPTEPLEKFWDNLKENPAESAKEDLFSFLEANKVPLTSDGCFIAYKKVKKDWWDSYTGDTHKNVPGAVIRMDRKAVDHDRRNTCSSGLHVAAWGYASTFSGERILEIKINPKNVVAVPPDYSNQKMRVCEYMVLRQTDKAYERSIYEEAVIETASLDAADYS